MMVPSFTGAKYHRRQAPVVGVAVMTFSKLSCSVWLAGLCLVACGDAAPAKAPEAPLPEPVAVAATPVAPAEPVVDAGPPPMQGAFASAARAASSGKVDKIGEKDGLFKPDGVKDLVFDVEFEGQAAAFFINSVDDSGNPNGEFDADSLTGNQEFPKGLTRAMNTGGTSAGVAVYENDKLLNTPEGGLPPLGEGKHTLKLAISSKNASKGAVRINAMLLDRTVVMGPVVGAAAAKKK